MQLGIPVAAAWAELQSPQERALLLRRLAIREVAAHNRIAKGAGGKGPRQKVSKSFSTLFDTFRAGHKTSKIVKKCKKVFRHFSTIFARHHFSGPFWGALSSTQPRHSKAEDPLPHQAGRKLLYLQLEHHLTPTIRTSWIALHHLNFWELIGVMLTPPITPNIFWRFNQRNAQEK